MLEKHNICEQGALSVILIQDTETLVVLLKFLP
jgi:hypothetical protein